MTRLLVVAATAIVALPLFGCADAPRAVDGGAGAGSVAGAAGSAAGAAGSAAGAAGSAAGAAGGVAGAAGSVAGSAGSAAGAAGGVAGAAGSVAGSAGGVAGAAGGVFQIAPHPAPPQILYRGGTVLTSPKLIAVTDDDYDQRAQVDDLIAMLGASGDAYWTPATRDYGIGAATGAAIHRPGNAPAAIDDLQIQAWLAAEFDGTHAEAGVPGDHPVFVFYFPATTKVTIATLVGCVSYNGYHSFTALPNGPWAGQRVAYAVIPECAAGAGPLYNTTMATSHEVLETVTDPFGDVVHGGLGWNGVDDDHKFWEPFRGGEGEIGDLCEGVHLGNLIPFPLPYLVQRIWSNSAALAGRDPCVPWAFGGKPYFNSAPVLADTVTFRLGGKSYATKGVLIPLGQQRTIEVDLFSDQPNAPWTVTATDLSPLLGGGPHLAFSWEGNEQSGQNGTKLRLTITAIAPTGYGGEPFMLTSSDGSFHQEWFGYVAQE